jgi:hypothetical protein
MKPVLLGDIYVYKLKETTGPLTVRNVHIRNDMVRFNNDIVRRKDKVKARKADLYSSK